MSEHEKQAKERGWTKQHFPKLEAQIERMEDEIIGYRRERLSPLSPSSFSYYLYEQKVSRFRQRRESYKENEEISEKMPPDLEKLMKERILEVLKQDNITLEDYPEDEQVCKMREAHARLLHSSMESPE